MSVYPLTVLIGRNGELSELRSCWVRAVAGDPQLAVLYGRRRVGKTFLCFHLLEEVRSTGQHSVYFNATQEREQVQLRRFADAIRRDLGPDVAPFMTGTLATWEHAFESLFALAARSPLCLVIDEVSFLTASTPGFASIVQAVWDRHTARPASAPLMLILTGSAVGLVSRLIDAGGALFRRPTWQRRLDPLSLSEATGFFPEETGPETVVEAYAACGGTPLYLSSWDPSAPTPSNLLRLAGTPGGVLLEDAPTIVRDEVGGELGYARVLAAIGLGRTRRSDIANGVGQRIDVPLEVLQRSGLIRRATPLLAPRKVVPFYELTDPYLRFWYAVLYRDAELIQGGQGRAVLQRVDPAWEHHVAWVFEEAARAHAVAQVGRDLPDDLVIGRWWDSKGQEEIDVLGVRGSTTELVGEARWSRRPVDPRDVGTLMRKAGRTHHLAEDPFLAVWSRSGATDAVSEAGVTVFGPADVVGREA